MTPRAHQAFKRQILAFKLVPRFDSWRKGRLFPLNPSHHDLTSPPIPLNSPYHAQLLSKTEPMQHRRDDA
jgi:hypothetical protein